MADENNPYKPLVSNSKSVSAPESSDVQVRRGRLAYLAVVVVSLIGELSPTILLGATLDPVGLALLVVLLFAVWRGHGWAITLMKILLALAVLGALVLVAVFSPADLAVKSGGRLTVEVVASMGVAYAIILYALLSSRSLQAFFKYQRQRRHHASRFTASR